MLRGALVAAVLALLMAPSADALTRKQAERIALQQLRPPKSALLHAQLLKARTTVVEAGPGPQTRSVRRGSRVVVRSRFAPAVKARTWLFWEDLVQGALFQHPSVLLLIDDRTGKVVRRQAMTFFPLIDGKRPKFLQAGTRAKASAAPPNLSIDCMVVIGDRTDPLFTGDFALAAQIAAKLKLAKYEAKSVRDLETQVSKAKARGCKDVMLVVAAHGYPATGTKFTSPGSGQITPGADHAQVALSYTVSDAHNAPVVTSEMLTAEDLRALMRRHGGITFKLVVSACFSGRWLELSNVFNLRVIATSSRPDQYSFAAYAPGTYTRLTQSDGVFTDSGGTLTNTTTNPTKATSFMNGLLRGLDGWASSEPRATDDLAEGIVEAFGRSGSQDFAAQRGATAPQLRDHTGDPPPPGGTTVPPQTNAPPVVGLTLSDNTVKVGEPVHFDGTATDADGTIATLLLDFGDGQNVNVATQFHAYSAPGIYEVFLRATDDDGSTVTTEVQKVFVSGPGTKDAVIDDAPCPGTFDVVVDISIPSYAQSPTYSVSGTPCVGSTVTVLSATTAGQNPGELDAWQQPRTIYRITLRVTGGTSTRSAMTVHAHWS